MSSSRAESWWSSSIDFSLVSSSESEHSSTNTNYNMIINIKSKPSINRRLASLPQLNKLITKIKKHICNYKRHPLSRNITPFCNSFVSHRLGNTISFCDSTMFNNQSEGSSTDLFPRCRGVRGEGWVLVVWPPPLTTPAARNTPKYGDISSWHQSWASNEPSLPRLQLSLPKLDPITSLNIPKNLALGLF